MKKNGFTLIEIIVVFAFLITLAGIILSYSFNFRTSTVINTTMTKLTTDLKSQQIKAMTGDTEGIGVIESYGINFGPSLYTLFHGDTFSQGDPTNFVVEMEENIQISNTLPNNSVVFNPGSGEINTFVLGSDTVTIRDEDTNQSHTIRFNKFGTITEFN